MIPHDESTLDGEPDPVLVELAEEVTQRLLAGEPVDAADFMGADPTSADSIRQLLPTLRTMVALSEHIAHEQGSRSRLARTGHPGEDERSRHTHHQGDIEL